MVSLTGADVRCAAETVADFVAISAALEGTKWLNDFLEYSPRYKGEPNKTIQDIRYTI